MSNARHWNKAYSANATNKVSWYKPHLTISLRWIKEIGLDPSAAIIDVGGGTSTLVDDLLDTGHGDITVLDVSGQALQYTQDRLGARSNLVTWIESDVTDAKLPAGHYHLWHDRAVFHFLTAPADRRKYRDLLLAALRPDGFVIVSTFSIDGPPKCSGLPVQRYSAISLKEFFGEEFELKHYLNEVHVTPSGKEQSFVYCLMQRQV